MNSIPTKIKVASLIGLATLIGIVVYVKADRTALDESLDNAYNVRTTATTNLNAVMKTQARANEYTSAEYANKMAPQASEASAYLALYEDFSHQDNTGGYARRTAPQTHPVAVKDKGSRNTTRPNQSYESYGVGAIVKNDTLETNTEEEEFEQPVDPRLQIETNVKQRVVGVDGYSNYSKDYSRVVRNAESNDDAYQVKDGASAYDTYKGYAVISANRTAEDGYARKRAPQDGGTNATPVRDQSQSKPVNETYEGYARVQVGSHNNIAQYDNAKSNDKAYQAYGGTTASSNRVAYGEYQAPQTRGQKVASSTDMAMTNDGYSRRRAPQGGTNATPVRDVASSQKAQSDETYGGYAVRTSGKTKSKAASSYQQYAQQNTQSNNESYGGYAVRTPGTRKASASTNLASTEGGYARRRAPDSAGGSSRSLAQYENASKNDYAYKSTPSTDTEESYGGYAVRTPGKKKAKSTNTSREYAQYDNKNSYGGQSIQGYGEYPTKSTQQISRISRARGGVPASTGLKMYGNRGERLAVTTSQVDRTVIVMPKRGRSIKGTVVQDEPGKNIIVLSSTGVQSTYRYGEIDAVVNI